MIIKIYYYIIIWSIQRYSLKAIQKEQVFSKNKEIAFHSISINSLTENLNARKLNAYTNISPMIRLQSRLLIQVDSFIAILEMFAIDCFLYLMKKLMNFLMEWWIESIDKIYLHELFLGESKEIYRMNDHQLLIYI